MWDKANLLMTSDSCAIGRTYFINMTATEIMEKEVDEANSANREEA